MDLGQPGLTKNTILLTKFTLFKFVFSQKHLKWPLDTGKLLKTFKNENLEKHFVWKMTKVDKWDFVICLTNSFSEFFILTFLRGHKASRGHFRCFWEKNKVKKVNSVKTTLFDKGQSITFFSKFLFFESFKCLEIISSVFGKTVDTGWWHFS